MIPQNGLRPRWLIAATLIAMLVGCTTTSTPTFEPELPPDPEQIAEVIEGEYIIGFEPGSVIERFAAENAVEGYDELEKIGATLIRLEDDQLAVLSDLDEILYIEPNYVRSIPRLQGESSVSGTNDPAAGRQYVHNQQRTFEALERATGAGTTMCFLDTGIDTDHEDLRADIVKTRSFVGETGEDSHGHGTHVSGSGAAVANNGVGGLGTGPEAKILHGQVLDRTGRGSTAGITAGIIWCTDEGAAVISMSLGGGGRSSSAEAAVDRALAAGTVIFAAAGNDDTNRTGYPAGYPNVISVAAVDSSGNAASFSNYASTVDIAAAGVGVYSTYLNGTYRSFNGTSMACPNAAGAGALLMSMGVPATEVRNVLKQTGRRINGGKLNGVPIVDAAAAVFSVAPGPAPTSGLPTPFKTSVPSTPPSPIVTPPPIPSPFPTSGTPDEVCTATGLRMDLDPPIGTILVPCP